MKQCSGLLLQVKVWGVSSAIVWSLMVALFIPGHSVAAQTPQTVQIGTPIRNQLQAPEGHYYDLDLTAGQFVEISLKSESLWLSLKIDYVDGDSSAGASCDVFDGPTESAVSYVAPATRRYRINVGANKNVQLRGEYQLLITFPSAPSPEFFKRAKAQRLKTELDFLYHQKENRAAFQKMPPVGEEAALLLGELGFHRMQADSLNLVGEAWRQLGEWHKAIDAFQRAYALSKQFHYYAKEAETLTFIGMCYYQTGDYSRSLEFYLNALKGWEVATANGNAVENMIGWTLMQHGNSYVALGEKEKALAAFSEGLKRYETITHGRTINFGEWHRGTAFILRGVGRVYSQVGEKQKALSTLAEALDHYQKSGDDYYHPMLLNDLGEIYASLGEREQAMALYERALPLEGRMGSRAAEAQTFYLIGRLWQTAGKLDEAEQRFNEALNIRRSLSDKRGVAMALTGLGEIYVVQGEARAALRAFDEALQIQREIGDRYGEGVSLTNLGTAYARLHDAEKAAELFKQSLVLRESLDDREGQANALFHLAQTANEKGQLENAYRYIKSALEHTELIRSRVLSPELRASYLGTVSDYYDLYIDVLMRLHEKRPADGHDRMALQISEQARARSLLDSLAEAHADIRAGVPADLLARERELRQRLQSKNEYQFRLQTVPHSNAQRAELSKELQSIKAEYIAVQARIRSASPRYAALTQPQPLQGAAIQGLLDAETALLEYALGQQRSYAWVVTREGLTSYVLPGKAVINDAASRVYETLTARNRKTADESSEQRRQRIEQADAAFPQAAAQLSELVLRPLTAQLNKKRLVIVAQEKLQFIPFAVLPAPASQRTATQHKTARRNAAASEPLLVSHEIVNLPSASALAQLRTENQTARAAAKSVAVIADPVFSADDPRVSATAMSNQQYVSANRNLLRSLDDFESNLPVANSGAAREKIWRIPRLLGTRDEADQIAALLPPQDQLRALSFDASRALVMGDQLRPYRVVHFATHALINTVHPELSGLVLSLVNQQGQPQDGFLPAHEIYNLHLQADTVVLSACQTGLGKEMRGEGLVGMTQSFFYAGAPRVVVSLWAQQDKATAHLMSRFYKRMLGDAKTQRRPVEALRAAQLEMRASGRWPSPYFWAGFTLQGEWR